MFFQKSVSTKFVCKYYAVDELCIVILTDFLLETLRNEDLSFECCDVGTTLKRKRMVVQKNASIESILEMRCILC